MSVTVLTFAALLILTSHCPTITRYIREQDMAITSSPGIMIHANLSLSRKLILSALMMRAGMVNKAKSHRSEIALFVT